MMKIKYLCRSNFKARIMSIELIIRDNIVEAIKKCYHHQIDPTLIQLQNTRKEFEGDITLVVFPFVRISKKSPEQILQW
jgi:arginyl-tRNA synthetase